MSTPRFPNNEELSELTSGIYQTSPIGMQGRIGGIYRLRIELLDGRIYESIPDTLIAPGQIDSLYYDFNSAKDNSGATSYGFNVLINAHRNGQNNVRYMWNMTGTFKAFTHPELYIPGRTACYQIPEDPNKCNIVPLCTGLRNRAQPNIPPVFKRIGPCQCCTCWYQIFNNAPILSDDLFTAEGDYQAISIYKIPLNEWIFMFKIHVQVSQLTLTKHAFDFFKSIRDQKEALGSLFQPITGKIPNNFIQIKGTNIPIYGIFYATGVNTKSMYVSPDDVPHPIPLPKVDFTMPGLGWVSCMELFPNATTTKPDFWED